jgi:hypothetical protein
LRKREASQGRWKNQKVNRFPQLSVALVGNYTPTPEEGSYLLVLEQQKRCSKTLHLFAVHLYGVLELRCLAKK